MNKEQYLNSIESYSLNNMVRHISKQRGNTKFHLNRFDILYMEHVGGLHTVPSTIEHCAIFAAVQVSAKH